MIDEEYCECEDGEDIDKDRERDEIDKDGVDAKEEAVIDDDDEGEEVEHDDERGIICNGEAVEW